VVESYGRWSLNETKAAKLIEEWFAPLQQEDKEVSARKAGTVMVALYRLLTGEMPQSPGIPILSDELPGVNFDSYRQRINRLGDGKEPDIFVEEEEHAT